MNIDTPRVVNKRFNSSIKDEKKLKWSQEFFVLAFLKYRFPEEYKDLFHADKPDLQGGNIFVEVTVLNSQYDMQANKEFAKYCKDGSERRIKTIEKTGNTIKKLDGIDVSAMYRGGAIKQQLTNYNALFLKLLDINSY